MNTRDLERALERRSAELETAVGAEAAAVTVLEQATANFAKVNGSYAEFVELKNRKEYAEICLVKARSTLETCTANVECTRQGLEDARRKEELSTAQREASESNFDSDVAGDADTIFESVAAALEAYRVAIAPARAAAARITQRFSEHCVAVARYQELLGQPAQTPGALAQAAPLLRRLLERNPGTALPNRWHYACSDLLEVAQLEPVSCITALEERTRLEQLTMVALDPKPFEAELARLQAHDELVATQAAESDRIEREAVDRETKRKAHAAHIASLEQQPDPMHPGRTQADDYMTKSGAVEIVKGVKVPIETWQSPRRQCEYNKLGQQSSTINSLRGRPVRSQVVQSHGQELRVDWFADHTHTVSDITEKPGLIARAVNAIVDAVSPT